MLQRAPLSHSLRSAVIAAALLLSSALMMAQRRGGGESTGGGLSAYSRPDGVSEKDDLKDFNQVLALQASSEQVAEFQAIVKATEAAKIALRDFQAASDAPNDVVQSVSPGASISQIIENARSGNREFQGGFSDAQKGGLRETAKRLAKADLELQQEDKKLQQSLDSKASRSETSALAGRLDKALNDFYQQELALGREMSIVLASGQDVAFTLPQVKRSAKVANQTLTVATSGVLSQVSTQNGRRTFRLALVADLSDLKQNATQLMRAAIDKSDRCGERLAVRQAMFSPAGSARLLTLSLHYERWTCGHVPGSLVPTEIAEGDGTVELKLTAALDKTNTLKIAAVFGNIDAAGMLSQALRSGSLGEDLRDKVANLILSAARAVGDFKAVLPPAVQDFAVLQSAGFQDTLADNLTLVLGGQIEINGQQADLLASQINQALSAEAPAPQ